MADFRKDAPAEPGPQSKGTVYVYADLKDKHWNITTKTTSDGLITVNWWYTAAPQADAQAEYELPDARPIWSAQSRQGLITVIEDSIDDARVHHQSPGQFFKDFYAAPGGGGGGTLVVTSSAPFPWWLLVVGYFLLKGKGR